MVVSVSLRICRAVTLVALSATQASASDIVPTQFSAGCRPPEVQKSVDPAIQPVMSFKIDREERATASVSPLQDRVTAGPQMRGSAPTEVLATTEAIETTSRWPAKEVRTTPTPIVTGIPEIRSDGVVVEQNPCQ